jgi:hypothetical protein
MSEDLLERMEIRGRWAEMSKLIVPIKNSR